MSSINNDVSWAGNEEVSMKIRYVCTMSTDKHKATEDLVCSMKTRTVRCDHS